jgi:hypothetical protein
MYKRYYSNNRKETKGRQVQKQYVPRYSKDELQELEGTVSSVRLEQMARQKKLIKRYNFN